MIYCTLNLIYSVDNVVMVTIYSGSTYHINKDNDHEDYSNTE